jgi:hypothetical protein
MIKKWIHRVFGLCKINEMSPMHYETDKNGKQVYYKRLYCKGCDTSTFERIIPLDSTMKPTPIECIHYYTGAPITELEYLFKTLEIQGLLFETDIRQLTSIGIPVIKLLSDHLVVPVYEILPKAKDGGIKHSDFEVIFQKITSPGGIMYMDKKPRFA